MDNSVVGNLIKKHEKTFDKNDKIRIEDDPKYKKLIALKESNRLDYLYQYIEGAKGQVRKIVGSIIKGAELTDSVSDELYYSQAKEILTMLFFGANSKNKKMNWIPEKIYFDEYDYAGEIEYTAYEPTAIQDLLTLEQVAKLYSHTFTTDLLLEVEIVLSVVSDYIKHNHWISKTRTLKVHGKTTIIPVEKKNKKKEDKKEEKTEEKKVKERASFPKAKALAFFYQSYEAKLLKKMQVAYHRETRSKYYLLLHDGIYTSQKMDKQILENEMRTVKVKSSISYELDFKIG